MAGEPIYALLLIGLGLRKLSMAPNNIPEIKKLIRSCTMVRAQRIAKRALTFETGMQNSGLALAIVGTQFDADVGMVIVAGLWGTWHIISGFSLAHYWRGQTQRNEACLTQE